MHTPRLPPPTGRAASPQVLDVLRHAKIAANHALAPPRTRQLLRLARSVRNEVPPPEALHPDEAAKTERFREDEDDALVRLPLESLAGVACGGRRDALSIA